MHPDPYLLATWPPFEHRVAHCVDLEACPSAMRIRLSHQAVRFVQGVSDTNLALLLALMMCLSYFGYFLLLEVSHNQNIDK